MWLTGFWTALKLGVSRKPDAIYTGYLRLVTRVSGLELCKRLRALNNSLPVLMLTARDRLEDKVAGLDAGADDYLVKPFGMVELLARLGTPAAIASDPTPATSGVASPWTTEPEPFIVLSRTVASR